MALDYIFSLFDSSGEGKEDSKQLLNELEMFKDTPHFKLGMFHKLIMNGNLFSKQIINFLRKSDPKLDDDGVDQAGEYMMYTRAWFWIEQVQLRKKGWKDALKQYSNEDFLVSIKLSISYFEGVEEYEKCAHLKKIQDFVEKNLPK